MQIDLIKLEKLIATMKKTDWLYINRANTNKKGGVTRHIYAAIGHQGEKNAYHVAVISTNGGLNW
jgi:hypothetical protein